MIDNQVKLMIDRNECIGFGECVSEDPEAVELGNDGCARAILAALSPERAERLCAVCPTGAIRIAS